MSDTFSLPVDLWVAAEVISMCLQVKLQRTEDTEAPLSGRDLEDAALAGSGQVLVQWFSSISDRKLKLSTPKAVTPSCVLSLLQPVVRGIRMVPLFRNMLF